MVSIIISAYNSEKTITKAINSCLNQSYKDIEVIIVNDCSTDNTRQMIENLSSIDSRIKVINCEVNGGAGLAKRIGTKHINGEYVMFLDSDDYIKENHVETLYKALIEYDVDVVSAGYIEVDNNYNIIREKIPTKQIQSGKDKFNPNKEHTKWYMNASMFKSKLLNDVEYSHRRLINDIPTLVKILYYANSILTLDYAGYYYVQNPNSIQHTASALRYNIFYLLSLKDMIEFFNNKGECLSNTEFINRYHLLLECDIEEDEYIEYKNELDELYSYYKQLSNNYKI